MLRVLVLTNMYPTEREPWFGVFVQEQVEALRRAGIDVELLAFDGRRSRVTYARAAGKLRAATRRKPDVIHAHYGLTGLVAATQRRAPVVTTFWGSDLGYVSWQGRVSWFVARITQPIFVSRAGAVRLGLPDAAVVPTAVDLNRFQPLGRAEARRRLGWDTDAAIVLFPSARANPVKRVDLFDRVVEIARARLPHLRAVSLEGYDRDETALVMNAVDALLLTSDSEGSPTVVREALACETPVVSVPVGDVAEALLDLPGCAVATRDPDVLATALLGALTSGRDPALRSRASEYSSDRVAAQLIEIYRTAIGRRG